MAPFDDSAPQHEPVRGSGRREPIPAPTATPMIPFAAETQPPAVAGDRIRTDRIRQFDFDNGNPPVRRILVLKLDHFGDFVTALPALRELREAFREAHIQLVCGAWNVQNARDSGLLDLVTCFNYFPERSSGWNGEPVDDIEVFDRAVRGTFDIAIDLRVDEDTRHLLARVDARLRCGIGSRKRFPLLDIALPGEHSSRIAPQVKPPGGVFLPPSQFETTLPIRTPVVLEGAIIDQNGRPFVQGSLPDFPAGEMTITVGLSLHRFIPSVRACSLTVEVVRNGNEPVQALVFGRTRLHRLGRLPVEMTFKTTGADSRYELRVRTIGKPWCGILRFSGVQVAWQGPEVPSARLRPVELHVGETLSLLVALVRHRTAELYRPMPRRPRCGAPQKRIVIAPFSNSSTRDWPVEYYSSLVSRLLEHDDIEVVLIGTESQRLSARPITIRNVSARMVNLIGRTRWAELPALLADSDLVLCNNSGIGHLTASLGLPLLALYSGSHQPQEWGPRGPRSHALMHDVPCSPCGFERVEDCPHDHACMRHLTPEVVLERVFALLRADADHIQREQAQPVI